VRACVPRTTQHAHHIELARMNGTITHTAALNPRALSVITAPCRSVNSRSHSGYYTVWYGPSTRQPIRIRFGPSERTPFLHLHLHLPLLVSEIFASCPLFAARLSLVARVDNDGGGAAVGGGPRGTSQGPGLQHPVSKVRPFSQASDRWSVVSCVSFN
jgi:hypothetical protein